MSKAAAYYFGLLGPYGHFLHGVDAKVIWHPERTIEHFPDAWLRLMDTGLLRNAKLPDEITGIVKWTCAAPDWNAFVWWDRSGDSRPGSNSGFYVSGFPSTDIASTLQAARNSFDFACEQFPQIVARQAKPFILPWNMKVPY